MNGTAHRQKKESKATPQPGKESFKGLASASSYPIGSEVLPNKSKTVFDIHEKARANERRLKAGSACNTNTTNHYKKLEALRCQQHLPVCELSGSVGIKEPELLRHQAPEQTLAERPTDALADDVHARHSNVRCRCARRRHTSHHQARLLFFMNGKRVKDLEDLHCHTDEGATLVLTGMEEVREGRWRKIDQRTQHAQSYARTNYYATSESMRVDMNCACTLLLSKIRVIFHPSKSGQRLYRSHFRSESKEEREFFTPSLQTSNRAPLRWSTQQRGHQSQRQRR